MLMLFPGFAGTINLGQNPLLSLGLLGLGWWLVSVGRPGWGGVAWGLLAFKPVWAVPFFLVALLTRRFRMTLSMAATGALLILMTLPAGGLRPWFDWLEMGQIASALYARDRNWVLISRDVQNLPRRVLLQFPDGPGRATSPYGDLPDRLGVGLLALIGLVSAVLLWRMPTPSWSGQAGCFTLLSGWLLGWHFMYYDSLLAALPVFVLLLGEDPRGRRIGWLVWVLLVIGHYAGEWFDSKTLGPPTDTLLLLALWLASGAASARRWFCSRDPF